MGGPARLVQDTVKWSFGLNAANILPHTVHSLGYSNNRHLLWYAVRNFVLAPPAIPATSSTTR